MYSYEQNRGCLPRLFTYGTVLLIAGGVALGFAEKNNPGSAMPLVQKVPQAASVLASSFWQEVVLGEDATQAGSTVGEGVGDPSPESSDSDQPISLPEASPISLELPKSYEDTKNRMQNTVLPTRLPPQIEGEVMLGEIVHAYNPAPGTLEHDQNGIDNVLGVLNWFNGAVIPANENGVKLFGDVLKIKNDAPFGETQNYRVLLPDGRIEARSLNFNSLGSPNIYVGAEGCFTLNNLIYALFRANTLDKNVRVRNLHELEHTAVYGPWYYDPDGSRADRKNLVWAFLVPTQDPVISTKYPLIIRGAYDPATKLVTVRVSRLDSATASTAPALDPAITGNVMMAVALRSQVRRKKR